MKKTVTLWMTATVLMYAQEVYATFEIHAAQSATVAFSGNGIIEKLYVQIGDTVKKGQLLGELINDDIQAQVEMASIAQKYAKRDYERQKKVTNVTSEAQMDMFAYKYENARAKLRLEQSQLDKTKLKAPFDGTITMKFVEKGDLVSGQMITKALTVQSLSDRRLILSFDQKYHTQVKKGDAFVYKIDGDETNRTGEIYKIYPAIDEKSRKIIAEVKAQDLPVGLFGDGIITTK